MSKYIVKNCPNYFKTHSGNYYCDFDAGRCQDCTDCIMKQIVELCRHYKKHSDCGRDCPSFGMFLSKLLSKLDIEKCK